MCLGPKNSCTWPQCPAPTPREEEDSLADLEETIQEKAGRLQDNDQHGPDAEPKGSMMDVKQEAEASPGSCLTYLRVALRVALDVALALEVTLALVLASLLTIRDFLAHVRRP